MSKFTEAELTYLQSQPLGRLATVNSHGEPQNAPVTFRYNAELDTIDIGGRNMGATQKFRNAKRNGLASFVVDDTTSNGGRGIEIRGEAQILYEGGETVIPTFSPELIRLVPKRVITWDQSKQIQDSRRDV